MTPSHPCIAAYRARTSGITLIELLVAIMIVAMVLTSAWQVLDSTIDTKQFLEEKLKTAKTGPAILSLIERDLRSALPPTSGREFFLGGPGGDALDADGLLRFVTTAEPHFSAKPTSPFQITSDRSAKKLPPLLEIVYYIAPSRVTPDRYVLYRGERVLGSRSGGRFRLVYDRIRSIKLAYLTSNGQPSEYWLGDFEMLPRAVRIDLVIEVLSKPVSEDAYADVANFEVEEHGFTVTIDLPCGGVPPLELSIVRAKKATAAADTGSSGVSGSSGNSGSGSSASNARASREDIIRHMQSTGTMAMDETYGDQWRKYQWDQP